MRKIKKDDVSAYEHKKNHDYVHIIYELLINIEMRENKKRLDDRNIRSYGKKIVNYSNRPIIFIIIFMHLPQKKISNSEEAHKKKITRIVSLQNVS